MAQKKEIPLADLLVLKEKGWSHQRLAIYFRVSKATIKRRIRETRPKDPLVLAFTYRLERLAADAPTRNCRKEVLRAVQYLRSVHAMSDEQKKRKVVNSLRSGALELEEIAEDCGFTRDETERILDLLVGERVVVKKPRGGVYNRGRKMKFQFLLV